MELKKKKKRTNTGVTSLLILPVYLLPPHPCPAHSNVETQPQFCLINASARTLSRRTSNSAAGKIIFCRMASRNQSSVGLWGGSRRSAGLNMWAFVNGILALSTFPAWRAGRAVHPPSAAACQIFGSWWCFPEIEIERWWCAAGWRVGCAHLDSGSRTLDLYSIVYS